MIDVITFRGTGEPRRPDGVPTHMVGAVTALLDESRFSCFEPDWPALIGPLGPGGTPDAASLNTSVKRGVATGVKAIQDSPNVCGIISYSLGGIVASRILEGVRSGKFKNADGSPLEIAFVVNLANPLRRRGQSVGNLCPPDTFGLHGERGDWPDLDVSEYANPLDIITSSPGDSPLRLINDGVAPFSFVEGARIGNLGPQIHLQLALLLAPNPLQNLARFQRAFEGVVGYLTPWPDGEHTRYSGRPMPGTNLKWTEHAAKHVNETF